MENIQLSILLRQYVDRLDAAIGSAEAELPDDVKSERQTLGFGGTRTYLACNALEDLRELSRHMQVDAEKLEHAAFANKTPNQLTR